jgi:hypothetical protein
MSNKWKTFNVQPHQEPNVEQYDQLNLITDGPSCSYSKTRNTNGARDHYFSPAEDPTVKKQHQFYGSAPSTSADPLRTEVVVEGRPKKPYFFAGLNVRPVSPVSLHIKDFEEIQQQEGEHDIHQKLLNITVKCRNSIFHLFTVII